MTKKVALKTLGCKVNQYETGALRQSFYENGHLIVEFSEKADLYIINTCAVTAEAERKSKQMIRKAARLNPQAAIIVTGCAVDSNLADISEGEGNFFIVSNYYKENIYNIFNQISMSSRQPVIYTATPEQMVRYRESRCYSVSDRIRSLVKIQDGCNQFCSYCIIPYLRGRARSRQNEQVLAEIESLATQGFKEIVLLGINLGCYGSDLADSKVNLVSLLSEIDSIKNIERIRLSSIELPHINEELVEIFNYFPKLCHHLHIPLQSGDDKILNLMNRKYTSEQYLKTIDLVRERVPDIAITTDVIVGFPGEDEIAFRNTVNFAEQNGFAKIHVFPYSERRFNLASFLPSKIGGQVIKTRSKRLIDISNKLRKDYIQRNIGAEKTVLIEFQRQEKNKSIAYGLTDNYIKVCLENAKVEKGQIVKVRLTKDAEDYVIGKPV